MKPDDFTDEDMAAVGRSLMAAIEAHAEHPFMKDWAPAEDPAEIVGDLLNELDELNKLINSPVIDDWLAGVRLEATHQVQRWGTEGDAGKTDPDWFWLVGYLAGKALFAAMTSNLDKAKHHTISTSAALLNWWRHMSGDATRMRPGIDPPAAANLAQQQEGQ